MNILVVGNGFDLAHGLPTRYYDFIKFVKLLQVIDGKSSAESKETITSYQKYKIEGYQINENIIEKLLNILNDGNKYYDELRACIKSNGWIEYFKREDKSKAERTWVDFEMDIKELIQIFDNIRRDNFNISLLSTITPINLRNIIKSFNNDNGNEVYSYTNVTFENLKSLLTNKFINDLEKELKKLIRALEIYLSLFVELTPHNISKGVVENIDKVISFNYTNTYQRLYDINSAVDYDFIHGKVDSERDIEKNNMVLGIDEYLEDERKNKDLEFIFFKKYFQRIYKRTGCKYKQWLQDMQEYYQDNNIYFYGHSLSRADKDILEELILCKKAKVTIYYHNDESYRSQITNLVDVIGQDKLIEKVYGSNPSIVFECTEEKEMLEIIAEKVDKYSMLAI